MAPTHDTAWSGGLPENGGAAVAPDQVNGSAVAGLTSECHRSAVQSGDIPSDVRFKSPCTSLQSIRTLSTSPGGTADTTLESGLSAIASAGAAVNATALNTLKKVPDGQINSVMQDTSQSGSPTSSVGTPKPSSDRSRFCEVPQPHSQAAEGTASGSNSDSAELQPAGVSITFHAPPASPTPCHAPVEVFARFPQQKQGVPGVPVAALVNSSLDRGAAVAKRGTPKPQPGPARKPPHGYAGGMPLVFGTTAYYQAPVGAPPVPAGAPPYMLSPTYAYGLMAPQWLHASMASQQRYGMPPSYFGPNPNLSSPTFARGPMPPSGWLNGAGPSSDSSHSSGSTPGWKDGLGTPQSISCPPTPKHRNGGKRHFEYNLGSMGSLHRLAAQGNSAPQIPQQLHLLQARKDGEAVYSEVLRRFKESREARERCRLEDVRGHAYAFCRDQVGSRFVQQCLEEADSALVLEIFEEVRPKLLQLITDVFGNYVIQRMLQLDEGVIAEAVRGVIAGRVLVLSLQMYGCRVVQTALEVFSDGDKLAICKELLGHVPQCIKDQNGNHVIQKVIECVQPSDAIRPIIEDIVTKTKQLSCHPFGCRLIQRVLEHCTIEEIKQKVVQGILEDVAQLSFDQYGNYVVQHLVARGPEHARAQVVAASLPQLARMAKHKRASNVVEVCIKCGSDQQRDAMLKELIGCTQKGSLLLDVMRDQYGNYVIRRALEVATEQQQKQLLSSIVPHLPVLQRSAFGRHLALYTENLMAQQAEHEPAEGGQPGPCCSVSQAAADGASAGTGTGEPQTECLSNSGEELADGRATVDMELVLERSGRSEGS